MTDSTKRATALAFAILAVVASAGSSEARTSAQRPAFRVLAFTKTSGFRHASIPAAVGAIRRLGARHGFAVDVT